MTDEGIVLRFNLDAEDVEFVVNGEVVDTVGTEVFESWVTAYNQKHGFEKPVEGNTSTEETGGTEDKSEETVDESTQE